MTSTDGEPRARVDGQLQGVAALCRLSRGFKNVKLPANLTWERLSALTAICHHGPLSISELSVLECVTAPTMSRTVAALEASGFVRCAVHQNDKRSVVVTITAKGKAAVENGAERTLRQVLGMLADQDSLALEGVANLVNLARKAQERA